MDETPRPTGGAAPDGTARHAVPTAPPVATVPPAPPATTAGMRLLAAGVPLTLLLDLAAPPDSRAVAGAEGGSAAWLGG